MRTPWNAGVGADGGPPFPADSSVASDTAYPSRLHGCACQNSLGFGFDLVMYDRYRVAEISFLKGET